MSITDWLIVLFFWMALGWFIIFVFRQKDVGLGIYVIQSEEYAKTALLCKFLVVLFWPVALWIVSIALYVVIKKQGITILSKK